MKKVNPGRKIGQFQFCSFLISITVQEKKSPSDRKTRNWWTYSKFISSGKNRFSVGYQDNRAEDNGNLNTAVGCEQIMFRNKQKNRLFLRTSLLLAATCGTTGEQESVLEQTTPWSTAQIHTGRKDILGYAPNATRLERKGVIFTRHSRVFYILTRLFSFMDIWCTFTHTHT